MTALRARIVRGYALLLVANVAILLLVTVWTYVSPWLALVLGGSALAAAMVWLAARRNGARTPEGVAAIGAPASADPEAYSVARDVDRVLAWFETALSKRIPRRGQFAPLCDPAGRVEASLRIRALQGPHDHPELAPLIRTTRSPVEIGHSTHAAVVAAD